MGDDNGEGSYRRVLEPAHGPRLVVQQNGAAMLLIVGLKPITLSHQEARTLGVSLVLGAHYARESEELGGG